MINPNDPYEHKINNDIYHFQVDLITAGIVQSLSPAAIKTLVIDDELDTFYHKGYLIVDNRYDVIERTPPASNNIQDGTTTTPLYSATYIFQGDGRDQINILIYPKGDDNGSGSGVLEAPTALRHSAIFFQATIYNIEEITGDTPEVKFKKLYFWDKYYEYLREKNVYWSTAQAVENGIQGLTIKLASSGGAVDGYSVQTVPNYSDIDRAIQTGAALKAFLGAAFPDTGYEIPAFFPSANFDNDLSVTPSPQIQIIPNDYYWDIGATNIFFSAPAKFKAIDSLNYLLDRHVSVTDNAYDMAIFRINRFPRCFTLIPLTNYFKNAYNEGQDAGGPLYIETIKLGSLTDTAGGYKAGVFTPLTQYFRLAQDGVVNNFALEPSVGKIMQKEFNTKMVHSYDYTNKQFQIDLYANNIRQIVATYFKNYVSTIKSEAWTNLTPGTFRTSNTNVEHTFTIIEQDSVQRLSQGRNKALYASIFANDLINIKSRGSTFRQAGGFIGVDRDGSAPLSNFDNKALGIYILTGVRHIFENNTYSNELQAMKTYTEIQILNDQVGANNQNIETQSNI